MVLRPAPRIVILSAPGTLEGVDRWLRRAKVPFVRLASGQVVPVAPALWLERLASRAEPDTVVVTSRTGVTAGVRPWRRASGPIAASVEFWGVGPETARALRGAGVRRVRRAPTMGSIAMVEALRRRHPRTIVYFRSNRAGAALARALRREGHRVSDPVVYRWIAPPPLSARARLQLSRANLLVATSPSALSHLRRQLDAPAFVRLARTLPLVVLGERSRRAAKGHGFRRVSRAPTTGAQRFTRHLLRELRDGRT